MRRTVYSPQEFGLLERLGWADRTRNVCWVRDFQNNWWKVKVV
jgi:hypothetical protein